MPTYVFRGETRRPCSIAVNADSYEEALKKANDDGDYTIFDESDVYDVEVFDDGENEALELAADCGYNEEAG